MPSQINRYYNYVNNYQKADEPSAARSVVTDVVNGISNLGGTVYGIISDMRNQKRADETSAWQMQQDLFSNAFALNQFNEGMRQYNQNYDMEKKAMDMTQSNFENSAQIRTADMAKAGLNPLNYSGSDGATVSFAGGNNVSGSANSSSVGNNQVNALGAQLLMRLADMKFEKEENAKDRKSAEHIADVNAEASRFGALASANASMYGSDLQSEQAAALLAQRRSEFVQNIGLALREQNEKERSNRIAEQLKQAGIDEAAAKRQADSLAHSEDISLGYAKLEQAEAELAQAKTSKEAEIAAQNKRTWIMFISNMIDTAVGAGTSLVGGKRSNPSRQIGFTAN